MPGEITATMHGFVHDEPQLRSTERGMLACRFRLVSIPREYDRAAGEWRDGEPVMVLVTVRGRTARHVAASLTDRVHVIVTGMLDIRDGLLYLDADRVGIDLTEHVAYIDATLPDVLAGKTRVDTSSVKPRAATRQVPKTPKPVAAPATTDPANWQAITSPTRQITLRRSR
ncbi:single-stranded DNA-binding protein [Streptomyces sp. NPDC051320]|uniref:single-stranded DNA-binding protein n=1 Tax=Streptomyces sp. NPDC051320 TaxID=3154644 RepID=UPI003422E181